MNPSPLQAAGYPAASGTSSFCGFHPRSKLRGIPAAGIKIFRHNLARFMVRMSLGGKFLIIFSFIVFLTVVVLGGQNFFHQRKILLEERIILYEELNKEFVVNARAVGFMSAAFFEESIKGMARVKGVVYSRLIDKNGEILMADDKGMPGEVLSEEKKEVLKIALMTGKTISTDGIFREEEIKEIVTPFTMGTQEWTVWMGVSQKDVQKAILNLLFVNLIFAFLVWALGTLIIYFALHYFLEPINALRKGVKRVAGGELGEALSIKTRDELEDLANDFNTMTGSLRKSRDALEGEKASLEIKVKARTQALEEERASLEEKVKKRTKELQEKIEQLERFNKLAVGRELKMIALKEEIKKLQEELEKNKGRKK